MENELKKNDKNPLKISTYNVEWFFEDNRKVPFVQVRDYKVKSKELAEIIAADKPDILGLQEVSSKKVLSSLIDNLKEYHGLHYYAFCGKYSSKRTAQTVGLLVRACEELKVEHWDSFSYERELERVLPLVTPLAKRARAVLCSKKLELLTKNIYATVKYNNRRLLLLNFHLKANFDQESTETRELEAILLQALIHRLTEEASEILPLDGIVLLGDFNDFDHSFPGAYPPSCHSSVLARIRESRDVIGNETKYYAENAESVDNSGNTSVTLEVTENIPSGAKSELESHLAPYFPLQFANALELVQPLEDRETAIYRIMIDHILYYSPPSQPQTSQNSSGKSCFSAVSCSITHRREDTDEKTRVSDHWPVTAVFSIE